MAASTDHVGINCDVSVKMRLLIGLYCFRCQSKNQFVRSSTSSSFVRLVLLLAVSAHGVIDG